MRRILVLVTFAALAMGAAEPAFADVPALLRTAGAEGFELKRGNGRAVISRRGTVFVTLRTGRVRIVDLPGGRRPSWNCGSKPRVRVNRTTVQYRGPDLHCRIWSGSSGSPWQVVIRGRGIFAGGIVLGSLTLDAPPGGFTGRFLIGDGPWRSWPRAARTYVLHEK